MHTNQQEEEEEEEEDDCSICNETLPKLASKFTRMTCCGKGLHNKCYANIFKSSMSQKQKGQCIMCRTQHPRTDKDTIEQLRPWVEKGKAWAQSVLGEMYQDGSGVEQSYQRAKELFEMSASQGVADAQYNLGDMHRKGHGVDQSYERAAEYFEAAARQGMTSAQYNLGLFYYHGLGVVQNFETARMWWIKSAEQEHENAIGMLQRLDKMEGRTTPSFIPPKRCVTCDTPETPSHKLNDCP